MNVGDTRLAAFVVGGELCDQLVDTERFNGCPPAVLIGEPGRKPDQPALAFQGRLVQQLADTLAATFLRGSTEGVADLVAGDAVARRRSRVVVVAEQSLNRTLHEVEVEHCGELAILPVGDNPALDGLGVQRRIPGVDADHDRIGRQILAMGHRSCQLHIIGERRHRHQVDGHAVGRQV